MNDVAENNKNLKLTLLATALLSAMGGPILAPALPAIKESYYFIEHIEFLTKILIAISGIFAAIGAILFGWISDRFGRKKTLIISLVSWGVFGSSAMIPQPFWTLLLARACFGLSLGGLLVTNTTLIADFFDGNDRRKMMGMQSSVSSLGIILALISVGFLVGINWHFSFAIFLTAFLVLPFVLKYPETKIVRKKVKQPLSNKANLAVICYAGFIIMAAFNVIPTQIPYYVKILGVNQAYKTGILLSVLPISIMLTSRVYHLLSGYFGQWQFFTFSGVILFIGFLLLGFAQNITFLVLGISLIGFGTGTVVPHTNVILTKVIAPESRGRAMGLLTSIKFIGLAISPIAFQPLLANTSYQFTFKMAGLILFSAYLIISTIGILLNRKGDS